MLNRQLRRIQERSRQSSEKKRAAAAQKKKAARKKGEKNVVSRVIQFLKEVRVEMKKVIWPSRDEVVNYTVVVLVAVTVVTTFVLVMDLLFSKLLTLIVS